MPLSMGHCFSLIERVLLIPKTRSILLSCEIYKAETFPEWYFTMKCLSSENYSYLC